MVTLFFTGVLMVFPVELPDTSISKFAKPEKELYVKTQYAGNMGFISVGLGSYFFNNKISADINYGLLLFSAFFGDTLVMYCKSIYVCYFWVSRNNQACLYAPRRTSLGALVFR